MFSYIKEFVHSDFGRTVPSLRSLLDASVDIVELDVDVSSLVFCYFSLRGSVNTTRDAEWPHLLKSLSNIDFS